MRSPLLDALRRLASEHAEASARNVDVERVRDERRARAFSRRGFVQAAGAVAGLAVASRAGVARARSAPRIAIVGGGIAGLNAALTLSDQGYASTVYEASSYVGGRMHSNRSWADGQTSEWCGELIDTGHKTILQLAKRFGLSVVDEIQAQPPGSGDTFYFDGAYYPVKQADIDFQPVHNTLQGQIQAAPFPTLYSSFTAVGKALDDMSLYDWIETYVAGGHSSPLGAYLDSAYNQEYGLDTQYQSSLNLVYLLGYQAKPGSFTIYGKSDERYHVVGGNDQIPLGIAASLPSGSVLTGWRMTRLVLNADGSYTLTFSTARGTQTVTADRVILTVPFSVLRGLDTSRAGFDALKQAAITQLGYGTNSKLVLQFDQRYWNTSGPWGVGDGNIYTDLPFQNTWESSRGIPGNSGVLVGFMGGSYGASFTGASTPFASADTSKAVQQYAATFLTQLEKAWPGITPHWNGRATLSTPWRDPNLLGSYSCWKVGQYTAFSGYEGARQGKCHFAGEHCSIDFQGFMEGGADEGARAAGEILADYKAGVFP
ncbi:MAG: FAD-dependent oxidoreductase [Polyangiaceae bacterium]